MKSFKISLRLLLTGFNFANFFFAKLNFKSEAKGKGKNALTLKTKNEKKEESLDALANFYSSSSTHIEYIFYCHFRVVAMAAAAST